MEKNIISEKKSVREFLKKPLESSQIWYTIDVHWWKKWKEFVNYDETDNMIITSQPLGSVDNKNLIKNDSFDENALQEYDFEIVPDSVWELLTTNYGLLQKDDTIFRRYIIEKNGEFLVEVKLINVTIGEYGDTSDGKVVNKQYSCLTKLVELEQLVEKEFNIPEGSVYQLLKETDKKVLHPLQLKSDVHYLLDADFSTNQILYVDVRDSKGDFGFRDSRGQNDNGSIKGGSSVVPFGPALPPSGVLPTEESSFKLGSSTCGGDSSQLMCSSQTKPGVCGLANLGNTCFMNSAIQCISNVPPLTTYFLNGPRWNSDLNKTNPLGMSGRIATAYAHLIQDMWSGRPGFAVPRDFKYEVAQFAPQFCGYSQHDSQELMMFLLDGLHEDLNRITNKPYIEQKNCANQPDKTVADENWQYHLRRNDSIIVDYFHGQLKSKVVCPDCQFVSVTFDPFACLSLPLSQLHSQAVVFVPLDAGRPLRHCSISLYKNCTLGYLRTTFLREIKYTGNNEIRIVQVHKFKIANHQLRDEETFANVPVDDQIVLYELPPRLKDHVYIDINFKSASTKSECQMPLLVQLPRQLNWCQLQQTLQSVQSRFLLPQPPPTSRASDTDAVSSMSTGSGSSSVTASCSSSCTNDDTEDSGCGVSVTGDERMDSSSCSTVASNAASATTTDELLHTETSSIASSIDSTKMHSHHHSSGANRQQQHQLLYPTQQHNGGNINPYEGIFSIRLVEVGSTSTSEHEINPISRTRYLKGVNENIVIEWTDEGLSRYCKEFETSPVTFNVRLPKPTVEDCLCQFLSEECLGSKDLWFCPHCKKDKAASKKLDVWRLPKVLVLHLKRFKAASYFGDKINTEVNYPIRSLDLSAYVPDVESSDNNKKDYVYDLVAVSNHEGCLAGGHYFCYAKNCMENRWYKFDDSNTSEVDEAQVVTKSAYVLVYVSRTCDTTGIGYCLGGDCEAPLQNGSVTDMDIDCNNNIITDADMNSPE